MLLLFRPSESPLCLGIPSTSMLETKRGEFLKGSLHLSKLRTTAVRAMYGCSPNRARCNVSATALAYALVHGKS